MIKWTRTAIVDGGTKIPQAIEFAKDITEFVKSEGIDVRCWVQQYGRMGVLVWESDFAGAGEMEDKMATLQANEEYWKKLDAAEGLFISGKTRDAVFHQLV